MFIVILIDIDIDSASNKDSYGGIIVIVDSGLKIRSLEADLGLDMRILGVDLVESIDKRLISCLDCSTNR